MVKTNTHCPQASDLLATSAKPLILTHQTTCVTFSLSYSVWMWILCQFLCVFLRTSMSACDWNKTSQKEQSHPCLCNTLGSFNHFKAVLSCSTQYFFSVFTLPADLFFCWGFIIIKIRLVEGREIPFLLNFSLLSTSSLF